MKNILPVEYPIVTGYPVIANALSVLQTRKETMNWILLNLAVPIVLYDVGNNKVLLDLGGDHTPWNTRYLYDDCPFLTVYRYDRTWFCEQNFDIIAFVRWNIDRQQYLYTDVCRQYISEYQCNELDKMHDLFVYGYDDDEKVLYVADFFYGQKYHHVTIPYNSYKAAFNAVEKQHLPHRIEQTTDIIVIAHRELFNTWLSIDYENRDFVLGSLKERLLECLGKPNTSYMRLWDKKLAYGINGYALLERYFEDKNFYDAQFSYYNCICIQLLLEHKRVLTKICSDILKNESLIREGAALVESATVFKRFILKTMVKNSCTSKQRQNVITLLREIKTQEVSLLENMLKLIS